MTENSSLIHGGTAARAALTTGKPFTGMAKERQDEVIAELEENGLESIVERNAIRLQTAADLYFDALVKAADEGKEDKIDSYVRSYGWLAGKTLIAWEAVKKNRKATQTALINVLDDYSKDGIKHAQETQQEGQGGAE